MTPHWVRRLLFDPYFGLRGFWVVILITSAFLLVYLADRLA